MCTILDLAEAQGIADDIIKLPGAGIHTTIRELYNNLFYGLHYIIKGRSIWRVKYTPARGFYSVREYVKPAGGVPLANPGCYHVMTASEAHELAPSAKLSLL